MVALPAKSRQFGQLPVGFKQATPAVSFRTNLPALDLFPFNAWAKNTAQIYKRIAREGHFTTHLQRRRKVNMERLGILCDYAQRYLGDYLRMENSQAGMQALAQLLADYPHRP